MAPERVVLIRPRTVVSVALILVGLALALWVVYASRHVLTWVLVALFLALAINPAVERLQRATGLSNRGAAAGIIYLITLAVLVGLGYVLITPLVDQVRGLADAAPGYVNDVTKGRGPLGFLETKYHIVEKVRHATQNGGANVLGGASTALTITQSVLTAIAGIVTVAFLTFFMVLEGPAWWDRIVGLAAPENRPRYRALGDRIAATISGYVTGNLLISLIAGASSALVLFLCGVPFALALGLLVAILDLIPLAGATIAGIIIVTIALLQSLTVGIIVAVFFIVYQQLENHLLQPLVYGRTVELSPLAVLISVLVGAELAGVLGALMAIPVAGALQITFVDWRQARAAATPPPARSKRAAARSNADGHAAERRRAGIQQIEHESPG
jgi:predicted PurR-regulated permease PerM